MAQYQSTVDGEMLHQLFRGRRVSQQVTGERVQSGAVGTGNRAHQGGAVRTHR